MASQKGKARTDCELAWDRAKAAAATKAGINTQLDDIDKDGRIPPDDADPEIKELFIETMEALTKAATG